MEYIVVLFKNKEKRKIINKFKTKKKATKFYDDLIMKSNNVIFPKLTENGHKCFFELAMMEKKGLNDEKIYIRDDMGRTIKVETDSSDYKIIKVVNYNIEEEFLDYNSKKKIDTPFFEKKFLSKKGVKMISKLNNKIILQNEGDVNLFTLKDIDDADRFINVLEKYLNSKGRIDCILVKDFSSPQKKYLYELLVEKGYPKSYLQRYSTTHPLKK
jgi:hypothetical protein